MRSKRTLAVVAATILSLAAFTSSVTASSPRSGDLHVTKECSQYTPVPGAFCTITSSNINAIKPGSRVVYASGPGAGFLDSDITIVRNGNSIAYGHVILYFATGTGTVTLSGGTGEFMGFAASAAVVSTGRPNWAWDGTYSFSTPN